MLVFVHLHGIARSVAIHLGIEWGLKDVDSLLEEDRKAWKDSSCDLHEGTAFQFVEAFAPKLAAIIEAARNHVSGEYSDYWRATDPLLWQSCQEYSEYSYVINHALETLKNPH
jgi:predicted HD phosphohydrolase